MDSSQRALQTNGKLYSNFEFVLEFLAFLCLSTSFQSARLFSIHNCGNNILLLAII